MEVTKQKRRSQRPAQQDQVKDLPSPVLKRFTHGWPL
jgi:hypothetical protein